jgi:hypothetical protein
MATTGRLKERLPPRVTEHNDTLLASTCSDCLRLNSWAYRLSEVTPEQIAVPDLFELAQES